MLSNSKKARNLFTITSPPIPSFDISRNFDLSDRQMSKSDSPRVRSEINQVATKNIFQEFYIMCQESLENGL